MFRPDRLPGQRCFLRYGVQPTKPIGFADWSKDQTIIRRLLERAKEPDTNIRESLGMTKKMIDRLFEITPEPETLWHQRIARARRYLAGVELTNEGLQAFEQDLLALPAVEARISAAAQAARDQAIQQAQAVVEPLRAERQQLTQQIDQQQRQIAALTQQSEREHAAEVAAHAQRLAELREQITHAEARLTERHQQLAQQIEATDAALTERLAAVLERPAPALAEIALLRAALRLHAPTSALESHAIVAAPVHIPHQPPAPPPHSRVCFDWRRQPSLSTGQDICRRLQKACRAADLASGPANVAHYALLSGAIALLSGVDALDLLECWATPSRRPDALCPRPTAWLIC